MATANRTLVMIAPSWLGDAVMSLPLVGLLASVPRCRLVVMANDYTGRVYAGIEAIDELLVLPKRGLSRNLWDRARALRRLRASGAAVLPPSFSSALTVACGGIPRRVGYAADLRRWLLTHALPSAGLRDEHLTDNYARLGRTLLEAIGVNPPLNPETPRMVIFGDEREAATAALQRAGAPENGFVTVVPGATYGTTKSWPPGKYRDLVQRLSREMPVVLAGTARERTLCEEVRGPANDVFNLAGETSLGEFLAILERSRVLVANDSGAPHAAASLGTPTVVIFGSTSPTWTRPMGPTVAVARAAVHCSPCFLKSCPTQLECYEGVAVDHVFQRTMGASVGLTHEVGG